MNRRLFATAAVALAATAASVVPASAQDEAEGGAGGQNQVTCPVVVHIGDDQTVGMGTDQTTRTYEHYLAAERVIVNGANDRDYEGTIAAINEVRGSLEEDDDVCWVIDTGMHDAARVSRGVGEGAAARIDAVLTAISGNDPVFWVDPVTGDGAEAGYRDASMVSWLETLAAASAVDPALAVLGWGSEVADGGFKYMNDDGRTFTEAGYTDRADFIGWKIGTLVYGT